MAELIELSTPERYAKRGIAFRDFTLDIDSLHGNCSIIAREMGPGTSSAFVLEKSRQVVLELGNILAVHRASRGGG